MKHSSLYLTIGLTVVLVGTAACQSGTRTVSDAPAAEEETNPILTVYRSLSPQAQALYLKQSENLTKPVPERLIELDELTIGCFGPKQVLAMSPSDTNLGGQCCGALKNIESYELQLDALHAFIAENGGNALIPRDPYDISVTVAQQLTRFDGDIVLSQDEQKTYDEAIAMSHHGGPCCCKCWKYTVMSGLAKKLIADEGWDAHQITELWDLSSSCGHGDETELYKHYAEPHVHEHP